MTPDQEAEHRDRHAGTSDEAVTEDLFARETGDHFADHAHARQNHDVNRRMRIEPEQVLEQNRVAAEFRIENADAPDAFQRHQRQRDREHRRGQHHDEARRIQRPDEQRQPKPGQARRAHLVDGDDEIQPGEDGEKPAMKTPAAIVITCEFA